MFNHTSLRETQAETPQRCHLASVRKAVLRKQIITNAGEDVDADKRSLIHLLVKTQAGWKGLKALKIDLHHMTQLYDIKVLIQRSSSKHNHKDRCPLQHYPQ